MDDDARAAGTHRGRRAGCLAAGAAATLDRVRRLRRGSGGDPPRQGQALLGLPPHAARRRSQWLTPRVPSAAGWGSSGSAGAARAEVGIEPIETAVRGGDRTATRMRTACRGRAIRAASLCRGAQRGPGGAHSAGHGKEPAVCVDASRTHTRQPLPPGPGTGSRNSSERNGQWSRPRLEGAPGIGWRHHVDHRCPQPAASRCAAGPHGEHSHR